MIRTTVLAEVICVIGILAIGCNAKKNVAEYIPSPDGKRTLLIDVNMERGLGYLCVKFTILNSSGGYEYKTQTVASDRMNWSMKWEGNDCVVLDSSDIGTYKWKYDGATWKADFDSEGIEHVEWPVNSKTTE